VIAAEHAGYDAARAVWNRTVDRRPRLIARCSGPADVAAAVRFARDRDLEIAPCGVTSTTRPRPTAWPPPAASLARRGPGRVRDSEGMSDTAFPIFSVRDLAAARRFYEELGFSQSYQFPADGEPRFVTMERGSSSIGLGAGGIADDDRHGLWVYVDDVHASVDRLRAVGAPIVAEPEDQPWGERVARTRDPDGNLVYLGMPL
jgi:lactoylglutathione lyase